MRVTLGPQTPFFRLDLLSIINPVGLGVHSELWLLLLCLQIQFQTLGWRMRIREGEWKEKAGNLVTHIRIQYQDWAKSSKILTLMSRALRLSRRPLGRDRVRQGCGWKGSG